MKTIILLGGPNSAGKISTVCNICQGSFKTKSGLSLHQNRTQHGVHRQKRKLNQITDKADQKQFKCCKCIDDSESVTFASKHDIVKHLRTHILTTNFKCTNCGQHFINRKLLLSHLKRKKCINANKLNAASGLQEQVYVKETHRKQFDAGVHANIVTKKSARSTDIATANNVQGSVITMKVSSYECFGCHQIFENHLDFKNHLKTADKCKNHGIFGIVKNSSTEEPLMFKCHRCRAKFITTEERYSHLATHLSCHLCNVEHKKLFKGIGEMRRHFDRVHAQKPCYLCHLIFPSMPKLKSHINNIHPDLPPIDRPLSAIVNDALKLKSQASLDDLEDYIVKMHPRLCLDTDSSSWKQELSEKFSKRSISSSANKIVVKPTFLGMCSKCNSIFKTKHLLESHVKANICAKRQNAAADVIAKKTKVRKFVTGKSAAKESSHKCTKCAASFHWKVDLRQHTIREHHKASKFTCDNCKHSFVSSGFLRRHISICSDKVLALVWGNDDDDDDDEFVI